MFLTGAGKKSKVATAATLVDHIVDVEVSPELDVLKEIRKDNSVQLIKNDDYLLKNEDDQLNYITLSLIEAYKITDVKIIDDVTSAVRGRLMGNYDDIMKATILIDTGRKDDALNMFDVLDIFATGDPSIIDTINQVVNDKVSNESDGRGGKSVSENTLKLNAIMAELEAESVAKEKEWKEWDVKYAKRGKEIRLKLERFIPNLYDYVDDEDEDISKDKKG